MKVWLAANIADVVFTVGLILLTAGCAWAWPPLLLIVPGGMICGLMIWSRAQAGPPAPSQEPGEGKSNA